MARIVLASASPRRRDLIAELRWGSGLGVVAEIRPADVDETPRTDEPPEVLVARLAHAKATAVERSPGELVVAADTVVAVDDVILGKPDDEAHAAEMLRRLSGTRHHVITGVHLVGDAGDRSAVEHTAIAFRPLGSDEISAYVATGEPMDKAGAFAIQGLAADFVDTIDGSHSNVVGLPLDTVARLAGDLGVTLRRR